MVALLASVPALAETLDAAAAQRFVLGKLFSFPCFDGSRGALEHNRGRAMRVNVSPLAIYRYGHSGRGAASPSTEICPKRSTAESSASSSLGQGDPESSASCSLGQGDPESSASSSLGQGDPKSSASSSLGPGERHIDAAAGTAKAPQYSD
jgi:hypothetical protein